MTKEKENQATIWDKINEKSGSPLPPFQWSQNGAFLLLCAFIVTLGDGGLSLHFNLSKIAVWKILNQR